MATPPRSGMTGAGQTAHPRPHSCENATAHQPRLDQHRNDQDDAEKRRHCSGRQLRNRGDFHLLVADLNDAGDRHAFAQHLVDQADEDRAKARSDHAPAAAEDRRAADNHRGDDDELGAKAECRVGILALGEIHQPGDDGAERGQQVGAHPNEARVDAGVAGGLFVPSNGIGRPAIRRIGEGDRADRRDDDEDDDLVVEAERVDLADAEEGGIFVRLEFERDVLAAGQAKDDAAADEQGRQRRDERRHLENRDEKAVGQADEEAKGKTGDDGGRDVEVEIARREQHAKERRGQAERRADGKVELLIDQNERHADGHDAVARSIAQHREQRGRRAEECGVEIEAAEIERGHDHEQAHFPSAEQERRAASALHRARDRLCGAHGFSRSVHIGVRGCAGRLIEARASPIRCASSFRSACRPSRHCPW